MAVLPERIADAFDLIGNGVIASTITPGIPATWTGRTLVESLEILIDACVEKQACGFRRASRSRLIFRYVSRR